MDEAISRRARRAEAAPPRKGDIREAAILNSLEELLEGAALTAISIDEIAKGAGISRPTLYFYFASRSEVFAALLRRTLTEFTRPNRAELTTSDHPPHLVVSEVLGHILRSWREHGTVLCRAVEALDDPSIDQLWQEAMSTTITLLAAWIGRSRAQGTAIDTGTDPFETAEALAWMVERGYYQLFRREHSKSEEERKTAVFTSMVLLSAGFREGDVPPTQP